MKNLYLLVMLIGSFGFGYSLGEYREYKKTDTLSMFKMKTLPSEFILSCSYMIENEEKK